jgi:GNAT superfamily N-acetyltransferase
MVMRPAQPDDLAEVLAVFEDVRAWMINRGVNTWRPIALWRDLIAQKIARQVVYLAWLDGQVVGTITLDWEVEELWDAEPTQAGYLAHFATRRALAGTGIGTQMLGWAEAEARRAGKDYLRLDCWAENRALCAYYERAGFERRGNVTMDGFPVALYEKRISSVERLLHFKMEASVVNSLRKTGLSDG